MDRDVLYKQMLKRIREYRKSLGMSQTKFGKIIGLSQDEYSRAEQGYKPFPLKAFQQLAEYSGDIDYFVTGQYTPRTELNEYMKKCANEDYIDFLKICIWIVGRGVKIEGQTKDVDYSRQLKYLNCYSEHDFDKVKAWLCIRETIGLDKSKMAYELGIERKRYNRIEENSARTKIDAALFVRIYTMYGFLPSLLLGDGEALLAELNRIWVSFDETLRYRLLEFLHQADFLFFEE